MDFLKKHYEKVLLGIVLVGLAVGTAFLPIMIASERSNLRDKSNAGISRPVKPLEPPDLRREEAVSKRAQSPIALDFSSSNKLFNSFAWFKRPDGSLLKGEEGNVGPKAVVVSKITPLYTIISLDSVGPESDSGRRYVIGVQREAAKIPSQRSKKQSYALLNAKTDAFIIREVKGPSEAPTELVLELTDTGEMASISKDHPYKRVDGYVADLKYEPERRTWTNRRVDSQITFGGEDYNIVAITKNEVVLSAKSNNKKTPISYNPTPDSK
jgi:hypothetical protein